ncbi:type II toxin-antitoxin system Phd/YefM family antitoxin [Janthinobacterium lividum]|uniref:type II toxin-antitoxin system Phd/YefM family antitoxin n=1 Tax=Janthinobacterium lividum TaxID=29581 RepID=UPI0015950F22|nr:type II toxin-antitoxin system prevent-host-death family antitoxin [Janthinobacterium lividum]QKY12001.1 type II toxin-antitoxin system prevent-host-death family antitoxin [Janthinobacterium lividum]
MNILTFSEARAGLKAVMDDVCTDHSPTVITRQSGEPVVMLSLADFNSIEETLYLLGSKKNANRLLESIEQLKAGKAQKRELHRYEQQETKQQRTS